MRRINIALDGHSSCGKSTIAKALAKHLGYTYIDTGAMYRGVTLWTLREGLWHNGEPMISAIAERLGEVTIAFGQSADGQHLLLNGEDVEGEIRGMMVSNHVSPISTIPEVRRFLVAQQQAMAWDRGVVMDGRDVGTVVMPDAELKFFVTASAEERAQRRYLELTRKGDKVSYDEILKNVIERDRIDSTRATDPLKQADDAILLDNTDLGLEEQQKLVEQIAERVIRGNESGEISVEIDSGSGFCFGVINAISKAEEELEQHGHLYSLGDIVHNGEEVKRLSSRGLESISYEQLPELDQRRVLFRAHGEAPKVYNEAKRLGIEVVDATCPVVLTLQKRIRRKYEETKEQGMQIVIFGKKGHAEVNGLVGQTDGKAIVIQSIEEAREMIDQEKPVSLFSQTTMNSKHYAELIAFLEKWLAEGVPFESYDSICRQVANRVPEITEFAGGKDWVYFIAGQHSSNGRWLYETALRANLNCYFVSSADEVTEKLPSWVATVGICGATSTPMWQMQELKIRVEELNHEK